MKNTKTEKSNMDNFFNEMAYEMAGDIGAVDNEDMLKNDKLTKDPIAYKTGKRNKKNQQER